MFDNQHFRSVILKPTLIELGYWAPPDEEILIGTMAHESKGGTYLRKQLGGPALGIYQMEPATHDDIWNHYLVHNQKLTYAILKCCKLYHQPSAELMMDNLVYATCMARVHYLRQPGEIPDTLIGQANYWKTYYNTNLGKGTVEEYIRDYKIFVGEHYEGDGKGKGEVKEASVKGLSPKGRSGTRRNEVHKKEAQGV